MIFVVGAVVVREGRCLITKRGPGGSAAFRWEFPGGKVRRGETHEHALAREMMEELSLEVRVAERLGAVQALAGQAQIELTLYRAELIAGEPTLHEHVDLRWARAHELQDFDFADADRPLLGRVALLLGE